MTLTEEMKSLKNNIDKTNNILQDEAVPLVNNIRCILQLFTELESGECDPTPDQRLHKIAALIYSAEKQLGDVENSLDNATFRILAARKEAVQIQEHFSTRAENGNGGE